MLRVPAYAATLTSTAATHRFMKSFKLIATIIALSLAASGSALAQEKKGRMTPEQQIERIETAVGSLTKAQKDKISAIIAKSSEEMQGVPKEQRKEKGAEMMAKQRAEIMKVLTPEQQEKYKAAAQKGGGKKNN